MQTSSASDESSSSSSSLRRFGIQIPGFLRSPLTVLLEQAGIYGAARSVSQGTRGFVINRNSRHLAAHPRAAAVQYEAEEEGDVVVEEEVSIRIIGAAEHETVDRNGLDGGGATSGRGVVGNAAAASSTSAGGGGEDDDGEDDFDSGSVVGGGGTSNGGGDSSYQRYDIQHVARWFEQILPFSLLLLIVFIRQHFQGFSVTIWIFTVMYKSNDILRKQAALKGERKVPVLVGISLVFMLHVIFIYWWYRNEDLLYPLILLPPRTIPPFWHAMFIILVNDIMVRQAAMALKCVILMYYKNSRGRDNHKQGQLLTLVEYLLLLYRALLPTPVWYQFFLNKEYGSFFSSLTTGLYLTFKLTQVVEKVRYFFMALRALSRKEVHYGSYATTEQVNAAGDLCAICQEKMHSPILLCCKHIFCEDCVSEWFERERTCPLCRALVKPAGIKSYGDGSTSIFFQLF